MTSAVQKALNSLPQRLTHFSMFIMGRGYAGIVKEITLPKIQMKFEDYRGGGMDAPVPFENGMEKLEAEFTLDEYDPIVLTNFGVGAGGRLGIHVRGALKQQSLVTAVSCQLKGLISELDFGTWKAGEDNPLKFKMYCSYYRLALDEVPVIEIDTEAMVRIIGTEDQLLATRVALLRA